MTKLEIRSDLNEKIYDIKSQNKIISQITSYFPLDENEKSEILSCAGSEKNNIIFKSIFSDVISEDEWIENKEQIKKKFRDELVHLD